DARAMYQLGRLFAGGRLGREDAAQGYMWFVLAEERGLEEARLAREQMDRDLDEAARREALDLAERWRAAAPGRRVR
ncbi:MAG TPA: hypothetical protein PKB11_15010, partial [Desulfovibrio sp.]|nr:hypothetical protein [Desulfovibrio sp.]